MHPRLLLAFFTLLPTLAFATHNRAGEIIVRVAGCDTASDQLTGCATIITYTESAQTEVDRDSLLLDWGDGTRAMIGRTRTTEVASGIQRNEYTLCHRYAAFGRYLLSFRDVNRVRGVRNIPGSVNIPLSVSTSFSLVDPGTSGCNSSPELTQHPIDYACIGSVWTHSPGAFDVDGDSLAFELSVPAYGPRTAIPNYVLPNKVSGSTGSLTIDPQTGQITWDAPSAAGEYNLTFLVKSFRNGLPLDTLMRDMQVFVDDCVNAPPAIDVALEAFEVVAGEEVVFEVAATGSPSENQAITLTAGGRPFELEDNPATFRSEGSNVQADSQRKTFRWVPTSADISRQPYLIVLRAADDGPPRPAGLATVRTVSIRVVDPPSADYQLFRPGVQYMYENPDFRSRTYGFDSQFYGVRVDGPGCSELYGSLEEVRRDDRECVVKVPSPFGYRVCQTPDSTVMHFDPGSRLVLYQAAAVGTRWVARDSAGSKLYAEVLSVTPSRVLGQADTLKSIGFFTEAGEVAGPAVTIGKHFGLVDGSRFYRIGQVENSPLSLAGLSKPALGVQLPPASSYGLAQVGDTIQIAAANPAYLDEPFAAPGRFATSFSTVVILAVDKSREDAYIYEVAADLYRTEGDVTVPFALDTVFRFSYPRLPAEMVRQPGARQDGVFSGSEESKLLKVFLNRCGLVHQRLSTPASFADNGTCGFDQAGLDAAPGPVYVDHVPFLLDAISTQSGPHSVSLQYLGSAKARCGSYLEQTDIVLSNETPPDFAGLSVQVYPNPTIGTVSVQLPADAGPYDLSVYSLSGQRLVAVSGVRNQHTLALDGQPAGAYFLVVSHDGLPLARRRVIVR